MAIHRWLLGVCLLASCTSAGLSLIGASKPAEGPPPAPTGPAPDARPHGIEHADVVAWARQARDAGIDCPMSPEQARSMSEQSDALAGITSAIGCMCSVELTCNGYQRTSCPMVEPSKRLAVYDPDGPKRNREEDQLIAAWEDRLYGSRKAPLAKISRATPLSPPDRAAYLATVDRRRYLGQLEDDDRKMADVIAQKLWGSLEIYQANGHAVLADLERRTCGAHDDQARAIVTKLDAQLAAHHKEIANSERVDRRINADPLFRRLTAERDSLEKQLAELENAHGSASDVCTGSARAGWRICKVSARLDDVNSQLDHRIDVLAGS